MLGRGTFSELRRVIARNNALLVASITLLLALATIAAKYSPMATEAAMADTHKNCDHNSAATNQNNCDAPAPASVPAATPVPSLAPQILTFSFDAFSAGFVGTAGTNADGTSVVGATNPTLNAGGGDTVQIVINAQDGTHNMSVYIAPCPGGSCAASLDTSSDINSASPRGYVAFPYPATSTTLYYYCDFHPDIMNGIINRIP